MSSRSHIGTIWSSIGQNQRWRTALRPIQNGNMCDTLAQMHAPFGDWARSDRPEWLHALYACAPRLTLALSGVQSGSMPVESQLLRRDQAKTIFIHLHITCFSYCSLST